MNRVSAELVECGGETMRVVTDGADTAPVVLFAPGLGESFADWGPVVPGLVGDYRLVRFSRPGLGGPLPDRPPTLRAEADRIAVLAETYSPHRPVLLVAHSAAALHAEAYARTRPDRIGGLVLVDPSCEPTVEPHPEPVRTLVRGLLRRLPRATGPIRASRLAGLLGPRLYRLGYRQQNRRRRPPGGPVDELYGCAETVVTILAELAAYRDQAVDLRMLRRTRPFPAVPVVVLTATNGRSAASAARWRAETAALAELLHGEQVVLRDSRHLVMVDRPDAVVDAVRTAAGTA